MFRASNATKRTQMNERTVTSIALHNVAGPTANLFTWRGNGIVLIGTPDAGRWVLARAWLQGRRLEYVPRWAFAQPIPSPGPVPRLITEANGNVSLARDEG